MRQRLNLNLTTLDAGFAMLVHSAYGAGKTHLAGDFLATLRAEGPVAYINIRGEDGYLSLASFQLGDIGETVETLAELRAAIDDYAGRQLVGLAVDSLKWLNRLVQAATLGTDTRAPEKTEWGPVHFEMDRLCASLRRAAKYVLVTCPSDKSLDQLRDRTYITPDLPGREAAGAAGWFDFVGYLSADALGPGKIQRKVTFAPNSNIVTRARTPRPIADVTLPEGPGGWARITAAINAALKEGK